MENATPLPIKNHIFAGMPQSDYQRILPHLEPFPLISGDILYEIDDPIRR